jgi:NADH-quinone oxidoreductase subunit M
VPVYSTCLLIVTLSSIGLPGLNGFVGEFLILLGAFHTNAVLAALAASGVILGATYMLWMYQRVIFGPLDKDENRELADMSARELAVVLPLIVMIFVMGLYPQPFLDTMRSSVDVTLARSGVEVSAPAHGRADAGTVAGGVLAHHRDTPDDAAGDDQEVGS